MLADYGYIGLLLIVAILFTVSMPLLALSLSFLGIIPRKSNPDKTSTYECGMETIGKTWVQFNFRYYLYAIIFVALDVLTVFLYPWAVNLKELGLLGLISVAVFFAILVVGYIYAWRKGALEWK
ncbi:MAG TPA: NAD(P)H-quinone oxidoreductase subunit 3 [Dehalococcoidia bacterium]|nr:NAD(P)H-quinone oxidoreductase subunit 3 [Dehalococcoidia bacterium]